MKKALVLALILSSCEFRMEDEEARKTLKETVNIQFDDLMVENRNMHYAFVDQGKEFMLAFIHGSPGSWNAFIDFFKVDSLLADYDMIAVDRPGFGGSGYGVAEPSLEFQAYQINEVIRQFPEKKVILIGHSLGGPVIARMAMDYPDAYTGLIMVAPSIDPQMEEDEWFRGIINTEFGAFLTPKEFEVSNDEILSLKEELEDMIPLWSHIKISTVIIQGTDDYLVPKENAHFASRMLVDSILTINMLEGVNHFIPWSHPEEIAKAIRQLADRQ